MSKHEVRSNILNSSVDEVLFDLPESGSIRWRRTITDHLFLYDPTLPGVSGGLNLNDIIWTNKPRLCQIGELVSRLKR